MRTPTGKECGYFYGDYYRGRSRQECRLLGDAEPAISWSPDLCGTCPVPEIQMANACEYMGLQPRLERSFPFGKRRVSVRTFCSKTQRHDFDPHIGCGECHVLPSIFTGENL